MGELTKRRLLTESEASEALLQSASVDSTSDVMFFHSIMCQVGMPRSKVKGDRFERICGDVGILISAGELWTGKKFEQQIVPYGSLPRLIFAWMNTYALYHKSPEIPVGDSMSEFLSLLGKPRTGPAIKALKTQMMALAACDIRLGWSKGGDSNTYRGQPIERFTAWSSDKPAEGQKALWPGKLRLSDQYYETLISQAVPLNVKALSSLRGSSLAMDIYVMLSERLHRIGKRPVSVHWKNLREQFGQEYTGVDADKDFRKTFLPALKKVLAVYPEARVKPVTGGVLLMSSPPPVPYRSVDN